MASPSRPEEEDAAATTERRMFLKRYRRELQNAGLSEAETESTLIDFLRSHPFHFRNPTHLRIPQTTADASGDAIADVLEGDGQPVAVFLDAQGVSAQAGMLVEYIEEDFGDQAILSRPVVELTVLNSVAATLLLVPFQVDENEEVSTASFHNITSNCDSLIRFLNAIKRPEVDDLQADWIGQHPAWHARLVGYGRAGKEARQLVDVKRAPAVKNADLTGSSHTPEVDRDLKELLYLPHRLGEKLGAESGVGPWTALDIHPVLRTDRLKKNRDKELLEEHEQAGGSETNFMRGDQVSLGETLKPLLDRKEGTACDAVFMHETGAFFTHLFPCYTSANLVSDRPVLRGASRYIAVVTNFVPFTAPEFLPAVLASFVPADFLVERQAAYFHERLTRLHLFSPVEELLGSRFSLRPILFEDEHPAPVEGDEISSRPKRRPTRSLTDNDNEDVGEEGHEADASERRKRRKMDPEECGEGGAGSGVSKDRGMDGENAGPSLTHASERGKEKAADALLEFRRFHASYGPKRIGQHDLVRIFPEVPVNSVPPPSSATVPMSSTSSVEASPPSPTSAPACQDNRGSSSLLPLVTDTPPSDSDKLAKEAVVPLILDMDPVGTGSSGRVYRAYLPSGMTLCVKQALRSTDEEVEEEGHILRSINVADPELAPRLLGVYWGGYVRDRVSLVMEWGGERMKSILDLDGEERQKIYNLFVKLHSLGYQHDDPRTANIVRERDTFRLIDFGRSFRHECGGDRECDELSRVKRWLKV
ncbi:hypothetical protein JCM11251_005126 [Rhodosporidiobolus azoricus]